jgi:hypothetical protein
VNILRASDNTWLTGPGLLTPREQFAMVSTGRSVLAFGGMDVFGNVLASSELLDLAGDTGNENLETPTDFSLQVPFPNPSSGTVRLEFEVSQRAEQYVQLDVFDLWGRRIANLADGRWGWGRQTVVWDGRGAGGHRVPSGMYLVRYRQGNFVVKGRLVRVN